MDVSAGLQSPLDLLHCKGCSSPSRAASRELFPLPTAPTMATSWPRSTSKCSARSVGPLLRGRMACGDMGGVLVVEAGPLGGVSEGEEGSLCWCSQSKSAPRNESAMPWVCDDAQMQCSVMCISSFHKWRVLPHSNQQQWGSQNTLRK